MFLLQMDGAIGLLLFFFPRLRVGAELGLERTTEYLQVLDLRMGIITGLLGKG